ncbi:hypothetical protein [Bosea sp. 2RAB26]|uniref:hypothetical protein n=1 Tax=Bosea sp. 2RAB26 TaxID=3237476 RepID=UPI003F923F55
MKFRPALIVATMLCAGPVLACQMTQQEASLMATAVRSGNPALIAASQNITAMRCGLAPAPIPGPPPASGPIQVRPSYGGDFTIDDGGRKLTCSRVYGGGFDCR